MNETPMLSADRPLTDPADDRLGYAPLARHLATAICQALSPEGLVIGLYGPWGSGKSSLLAFIERYLKQEPEDNRPTVVRFNPWWFSGHEDLARRFFGQLRSALKSRSPDHDKVLAGLAIFARIFAEVPVVGAKAAGPVADALDARQSDVPAIKARLVNAFRQSRKRVVVVIDDIDRLTAEEIRQLFGIIKGVADFPNTIYLMAFDREVVVRALERAQDSPGAQYLEKIVQLAVELPYADPTILRAMFIEKVSQVVAQTDPTVFKLVFDEGRWGNVLVGGIDQLLNTPRQVSRLINQLAITYPVGFFEV